MADGIIKTTERSDHSIIKYRHRPLEWQTHEAYEGTT